MPPDFPAGVLMEHTALVPHGVCWLWDWRLIALHAPADLFTFLAYAAISLTAVFIYRRGRLHKLKIAYPGLWAAGAGFVFFCGLSHFGAFLEIWIGGSLYWFTGINKMLMALVSVWFAYSFFRLREEIATVGRVLHETDRQTREEAEEREINQ